MNSDELYTLKSMVLDNYEQYHDGLRILLESDKGIYKAFGQSPRTKYLKTENFYLTSKERLTYMMGFIDALAWLTRQGKLVPDTFPTDIAGFTDPEDPRKNGQNILRSDIRAYRRSSVPNWKRLIKKTKKCGLNKSKKALKRIK